MIKNDIIKIEVATDYYPEDDTCCIVLVKKGFFQQFWIDNPANPEKIIEDAKKIESSVNNMTDEFIDSVTMIRTGGDERLDIAYELCDYLARNQKLLNSLMFNS